MKELLKKRRSGRQSFLDKWSKMGNIKIAWRGEKNKRTVSGKKLLLVGPQKKKKKRSTRYEFQEI